MTLRQAAIEGLWCGLLLGGIAGLWGGWLFHAALNGGILP